MWPDNPYDVVTVWGNKDSLPWTDPWVPRFVANELRRCDFVGVTLKFVVEPPVGCGAESRHMVTAWGDEQGSAELEDNPSEIWITDSDDYQLENGEDVRQYPWLPYDPVLGWRIPYDGGFQPFVMNVVTLSRPDEACDGQGQTVTGSYEIEQTEATDADGLDYEVGTDVRICTYGTELDWATADVPQIVKVHEDSGWEHLEVQWDFGPGEEVPQDTLVRITTDFLLPRHNGMSYRDVRFTYAGGLAPLQITDYPSFRWTIDTPDVATTGAGGWVVGAFELWADAAGTQRLGRYRLQHEYGPDQNPLQHLFRLDSLEPLTAVYVGGLRFGASPTRLDTAGLWAFSGWTQQDPTLRLLPPDGSLAASMDWGPGTPSCFGVACPCGNDDPFAGCANSTGRGGQLSGLGSTGVAADDLVLHATRLSRDDQGLFYMGALQVQFPLFDGHQCALGQSWRFLCCIQNSGASGTMTLGPGIAASAGGLIVPGTTWHFHAWHRDFPTSPCGTLANFTNLYSVTFTP